MLSGKFRDPLIGRDLLAVTLFGSIIALENHLASALPGWFNIPGQTTMGGNALAPGPPQDVLGFLLGSLPGGIFPAFSVTFALFLARTLRRNYWLSVVTTGVLALLVNLGAENFALEGPFALLTTLIAMFVLLRLGTLALAVGFVVAGLLNAYPVTIDLSQWNAPHSFFMSAVLLALLFYGLRVASGNRPLLAD